MTTQRKIPHLLATVGDGRDFHYLPVLGAPFDLTRPIAVTEKVDGSTMQCLNGVPFKRYDNFKAGDPRKHGASEEERYRLERCSREKPHEQHYLAAFDAYADAFARAPSGIWIYFEAIGPKIGARYKASTPTVRVFDVAEAGEFLPFFHAIGVAAGAGLPVVAHEDVCFGNLDALLSFLSVAESRDSDLPPHELEGWVLRQDLLVAKIRKGDLGRVKP